MLGRSRVGITTSSLYTDETEFLPRPAVYHSWGGWNTRESLVMTLWACCSHLAVRLVAGVSSSCVSVKASKSIFLGGGGDLGPGSRYEDLRTKRRVGIRHSVCE